MPTYNEARMRIEKAIVYGTIHAEATGAGGSCNSVGRRGTGGSDSSVSTTDLAVAEANAVEAVVHTELRAVAAAPLAAQCRLCQVRWHARRHALGRRPVARAS